MKGYKVSAGVIVEDGKILCVQRGKGKYDYISFKYEFPGGKIEGAEDAKEALARELMEEMELDIGIETMEYLTTVYHTYPDFHIEMHAYLCPVVNPEFTLLEHMDFKWMPANRLWEMDWAEADWPIVKILEERNQ